MSENTNTLIYHALRAIEALAMQHPEFTTDDVWAYLEKHNPTFVTYFSFEPRSLGHAMKLASRNIVIDATDAFIPSKRPECHRRPVRVWRSMVYRAAA